MQAYLFRVGELDGGTLIGRPGAKDMAGIGFPNIWPGETRPRSYRLRRDVPDYRWLNGKLKEEGKYLSEPRARNLLYIPPGTLPAALADTATDLLICEGEKKALCASWLAVHGSTTKPRWLAVGLSGVWCFRDKGDKGVNSKGERVSVNAPIPDLSRIAWKSRRVLIVFDKQYRDQSQHRSSAEPACP